MATGRTSTRKQTTIKRIAIIFLLSLVLSLAGLYLVSPETPLNLSKYHLVNWSLPFVTICIITALTNLLTPAVRILILCREQAFPISYFTALKVTLTTNFASALTPGRAGGAPIISLGTSSSWSTTGTGSKRNHAAYYSRPYILHLGLTNLPHLPAGCYAC